MDFKQKEVLMSHTAKCKISAELLKLIVIFEDSRLLPIFSKEAETKTTGKHYHIKK